MANNRISSADTSGTSCPNFFPHVTHECSETNLAHFFTKNSAPVQVSERQCHLSTDRELAFPRSILEATHSTLKSVFGVGPEPLDHPGIVVAIGEVMVQC